MTHRHILIATLLVPACYAHESTESAFTQKSLIQYYDNVTANRQVSIEQHEKYIVVIGDSGSIYAFTKVQHAGHPGYIEWQYKIEGDEPVLLTTSEHGKAAKPFHDFEKSMNAQMSQRFDSKIVHPAR